MHQVEWIIGISSLILLQEDIKKEIAIMKKILVILISIVLVIGLSACGNTTNGDTKDSESPSSAEGENTSKPTSKEELVYDSTEAFEYEDVEGGVTITHFQNYDCIEYDKIYIPSKIDGKSVIGIGSLESSNRIFGAIFGKCEIVIPSTITYIGCGSFESAMGLVKLSGGENCKTIGEFAFMNCENLKEVTFINNVTDLADNAFAGCTAWEANH